MRTDRFGLRLGGEKAEYISLAVSGREYPNSTDYWDANWLICTVEIAVGPFRGRVGGMVRADELEVFAGQLQQLNERLHGEAEFSTMEEWLSLRLVGDGRGRIEARCQVSDKPSDGSTLTCCLIVDQTLLPPLLRELSDLIKAYPVWFKSTVE
jgi:hypothetical protein